MTVPPVVVADVRRSARQVARCARRVSAWARKKDLPKRGGGIAAGVVGFVVLAAVKPLWATGLIAALWVVTAPTRHMLRPRWRRAAVDAGLDHPPHIVPRSIERTAYGYTAELTIKAGFNSDHLISRQNTFASHLGVREVTIEPGGNDKGHATLDVVERLPWTPEDAEPWPLADATELSVWDTFPIAVDMRLEPVYMQLCEPGVGGTNLLVGGMQGSGKSTTLHLPTAVAALDPTCDVFIFDGKLAEMHAWRDRCVEFVGYDLNAAIRALERMERWVNDQYERLAKLGRRKALPGDRTAYWLCDEWSSYTHHVDRKAVDRFVALADSVVHRGRAVGLSAAFGALKPSADVVPTSTRDLLDLRFGFRCKTRPASDMVLGEGMAAAGWDSRTIPRPLRGVGYLMAAEELPRLARSCYLTDEQLARLAAQAPTPQPSPQPNPATPSTPPTPSGNGDQPIRSPLA